MDYEIIDLYHNNQSERWIVVHADGALVLHTDYSCHSTDEAITLEDLQRRNPIVAAEIAAALERLKDSARDASAL